MDVASFRNVGAYRYNPPSKLRHPSVVHPTHDVFAVGVTAYLLLTNEYPWSVAFTEDAGHLEAQMRSVRPRSVDTLNSLVSHDVAAFIDDLLITNDDDRPTASEALSRVKELILEVQQPRTVKQAFFGERGLLLPRVIRDPIHGDIRMTEFEWQLIDTPEFQRLRYIKQLGLTHLVFPGAEHTRFHHSIGALCLAEKILRSIAEIKGTTIGAEERLAIRSFTLVHDVTHICFGHTIEDELGFYPRHDRNYDRYDRLVFSPQSKLGSHLKSTSFGLEILDLIEKKVSLSEADETKTLIEQIVEGPVGADVLDYIDGDSYFCGLDHKVDTAIFRRYSVHSFAQRSNEPRYLIPQVIGTYGLRFDARICTQVSVT